MNAAPADARDGNRLSARHLEPSDRPIIRKWLKDPVIQAAIGDETILPSEPGKTLSLFEKSDPFKRGDLCLVLERGNEPVGLIHFVWINWLSRNAEAIVFIGPPELRRSAVAFEALVELGGVAFRRLNLHKIYAFVYGANEKSLALFKRFMKVEARLENYVMKDGSYEDVFILSMLATEYSHYLNKYSRALKKFGELLHAVA